MTDAYLDDAARPRGDRGAADRALGLRAVRHARARRAAAISTPETTGCRTRRCSTSATGWTARRGCCSIPTTGRQTAPPRSPNGSRRSDGQRLLYAVQDGGTDWRILKVLDVDTGAMLHDEVEVGQIHGIDWAENGSGFFYSRFPEPAAGAQFQACNLDQAVYFHRSARRSRADRLVIATPDRPELGHSREVTDDGRWLSHLHRGDRPSLRDHADRPEPRRRLRPRTLLTRAREQLVACRLGRRPTSISSPTWMRRASASSRWTSPAPSRPIRDCRRGQGDAGRRDAGRRPARRSPICRCEERGASSNSPASRAAVALPGIGIASGFGGRTRRPETSSPSPASTPTTIYRLDTATGETSAFAQPEGRASIPTTIVVEQRFYASKDGTRIPMFVVRQKDLTTRAARRPCSTAMAASTSR